MAEYVWSEMSVKDLRTSIKELRAELTDTQRALMDENLTLEQFAAKTREAAQLQDNLSTAMGLVRGGVEDQNNSYYNQQARLTALNRLWRSLDPTIQGNAEKIAYLRNEAAQLSAELYRQDQIVGAYYRNVGNYPQAMAGVVRASNQLGIAFQGLGSSLSLMASGNAEVQKALIYTQGALALLSSDAVPKALMALKAFFGTVLSGFKAIYAAMLANPITAAMVAIGVAVAGVVAVWKDALSWFGLTSPIDKAKKALEDYEAVLKRLKTEAVELETKQMRAFAAELLAAAGNTDKLTEATEKYAKVQRDAALATAKAQLRAAQEAERTAYKAYQEDYKDEDVTATFLKAKEARIEAEKQVASAELAIAQATAEAERKTYEERLESAKVFIEERKRQWEELATAEIDAEKAKNAVLADLRAESFADWAKRREEQAAWEAQMRAENARQAEQDEKAILADELKAAQDYTKDRLRLIKAEETAEKAKVRVVSTALGTMGSIADDWVENEKANAAITAALDLAQIWINAAVSAGNIERAASLAAAQTGIGAPAAASAIKAWGYSTLIPPILSSAATISKLMSTLFGSSASKGVGSIGSGSFGQSSVVAPAVVNQVQTIRSLTGDSERNQDQRVVLVYGDVQEADKRVQVVGAESTF